MVIAGVKGTLASGIDLIYDRLFVPTIDEISNEYALMAELVRFPPDHAFAAFRLRPQLSGTTGRPLLLMCDFLLRSFRKYSPQQAPITATSVQSRKSTIGKSSFTSICRVSSHIY